MMQVVEWLVISIVIICASVVCASLSVAVVIQVCRNAGII